MALPMFYSTLHPFSSKTTLSFPIFNYPSEPFSVYPQPKHFFSSADAERRDSTRKKKALTRAAVAEEAQVASRSRGQPPQKKKLRILVAGGGIGGLVFALAAKNKGFDVLVFERDVSAIRGEGKYRGPIQLQSNALAALEAIDLAVADQIMDASCITGDRINGMVDGISGTWYVKFDTFTPAVERGLPVTRVISRMTLQEILAQAVGEDTIMNGSNVVDFEDDGTKVSVILENGQRYEGDLLVGADGIWSKVRKSLFGSKEASYSDYTCYTGLADYVPADIETVGYRVFLGHKQYFVSSDVGSGKMQWYAFHKEPPGGVDAPNGKKERLLKIFGGWCDKVVDLLNATNEDEILRRDIYDRVPVLTWGKGRVTLLGDAIHAMQPNLGQGGCMAIEDSYQLALEIEKAWKQSVDSGTPIDIPSSLKKYEKERRIRVGIICGLARMAASMASTYRPYLGVGLGPLSFLTKLRIPHPGRVGGRPFIKIAMPLMLSWVLGGNSLNLEGRPLCCRLSDKASSQLRRWFEDDDAMERALNAEWYLFPTRVETNGGTLKPIHLSRDEKKPCTIGNVSHPDLPGVTIAIPLPQEIRLLVRMLYQLYNRHHSWVRHSHQRDPCELLQGRSGIHVLHMADDASDHIPVSEMHARIHCKDNAFYLTDLQSQHGTWITDNEGRRYRVPPNFPVRFHPSYSIEFGSNKAIFRVKVLKDLPETAMKKGNQILLAT